MSRYSAFAIARNAFSYHQGWERAWAKPEMKKEYDAVIVGAGGHGLATAYYLGKNYGITNLAIIEKGWLGGGNTGRNTTIIRSNYLQDPSAAIYEKARSLYETMSQDLNYNVMFSPRGVMMLAQTEAEIRGYKRTAHANKLQGVKTEYIGPQKVKELCPIIELSGPRFPVLGALWQPRAGTARHDAVAWGYARACSDMGMDIIQQCEVTSVTQANGKVTGLQTTKGSLKCKKLGIVVAGNSGHLADMAGFRLPLESVSLQAEGAPELFHGYTYSGIPCAVAAALAVQDIFDKEDIFKRAKEMSPYFQDGLHSLKDIDVVTGIRGYGMRRRRARSPAGWACSCRASTARCRAAAASTDRKSVV